MGTFFSLAGYLFVFVISIISALSINQPLYRWLLFLSAVVTLVLAITRLLSAKKMADRVKYLEDNHLSFDYNEEEEGLAIKKGLK